MCGLKAAKNITSGGGRPWQRQQRLIELRNCLPTDPLVLMFNQLNHI